MISNRHLVRIYLSAFFWLIAWCIWGQKTMLHLEHSNTLSFDSDKYPDCQILRGDVRFRHDEAVMWCDSAFFYDQKNTVFAYGHIKINQADTLFIYGDRLIYNGNTRLAKLRENVRMENKGTTLYTDSLNYNRNSEIAYYFTGGKIVDSLNVLTSVNGKYHTKKDVAVFQKKVVLTNPDFVLNSDTLRYNTNTHIADILGPSTILYDSTLIYSEYGWYNTENEHSHLLKNSYIQDKEGKTLHSDTIYYQKREKIAQGYTNTVLRDSANSILLRGNYGIYKEDFQSGKMTLTPTIIHYNVDNPQDSIFLTADTIFYQSSDTLTTLKGYYNVQSWNQDFQHVCDSIFYSSQDSTAYLYGSPVAWNDSNQIVGDMMQIKMKNDKVDRFISMGDAFALSKNDTVKYNQMYGKEITTYFRSDSLYKINVQGNALTVYWAQEEEDNSNDNTAGEEEYVGINRAESSELNIYIGKDNTVERLVMTPASNGVMYTLDEQNNQSIIYLKGFALYDYLRPKDKYDIYNKKTKKALEETKSTPKANRRKKKR